MRFSSVRTLAVIGLAVLALSMIGVQFAAATPVVPGTYQLLDHGDGGLGPAYGLRVDALGEVFSLELGAASVTLFWDGGTTAIISGTLNQNTLGGNGGVGATWTVNYTLTGVSAVAGPNGGFVATGGSGLLTDPFLVDTVLTGEQGTEGGGFGFGNAFVFLGDGHRISGDSTSEVGRGWLLPPGSIDDWIFRAQFLPEPSLGILICAGLVLAGRHSRRRA